MTKEQEMLKVSNNYGVNQVKALGQIESVRVRPGMYVGSTSQSGIDQLVYEVIDNSFDEFIAGFGKHIYIHVKKDCSVNVQDEGRGIPVGVHPEWKNDDGSPMDTLTGILTKLHAGGKFGGNDTAYKCFTADSRIHTTSVLKCISDIVAHNEIKNAYNQSDEVSEVFKYPYDGDVNVITTKNNKTLKAIDGHYILIKRNDNLYWEKINNILPTDFLVELEESDDVETLKKTIPTYNIVKYIGE